MTILYNFDKNKERDGAVTHFEFEKMANFRSWKQLIDSVLDNIDYFMTFQRF